MTAPIVDQIIDAFIERLKAIPDVAVEDHPSGDPDTFPCLVVEAAGPEKIGAENPNYRYRMVIVVDGYVQGSGGTAVRQARNALYGKARDAVMGDQQLGGLCERIEEGDTEVHTATLASKRTMGFMTAFIVQFSVRQTDSTAQ